MSGAWNPKKINDDVWVYAKRSGLTVCQNSSGKTEVVTLSWRTIRAALKFHEKEHAKRER